MHTTGEMLAVLAYGRDYTDPDVLTAIADRYERAARTPHLVLPASLGAVARELRFGLAGRA